jgi:hypothetical protein
MKKDCPEIILKKAAKNICCGGSECSGHDGDCRVYYIPGWGHFSYCEKAKKMCEAKNFHLELVSS